MLPSRFSTTLSLGFDDTGGAFTGIPVYRYTGASTARAGILSPTRRSAATGCDVGVGDRALSDGVADRFAAAASAAFAPVGVFGDFGSPLATF